ncbi:MAG: M23 family peptidase, partial [Acinetobacter sp.]
VGLGGGGGGGGGWVGGGWGGLGALWCGCGNALWCGFSFKVSSQGCLLVLHQQALDHIRTGCEAVYSNE